MAEYIEREAAYRFFKDQLEEEVGAYSKGRNAGLRVAMSAVMNKDAIPAADVRPVVRCRECKHKGWVQEPEHGKSVDYCRLIERCVDKQFFCAAGERKTNCGARMEES